MPKNRKKYLLLLIIVLTLLGCNRSSDPQAAKTSSNSKIVNEGPMLYKGVSISPKSFKADDYLNFYAKSDELGNMVSWQGDIIELGDETKTPYSIVGTSREYNLEPLIVTTYFQQSTGMLIRPFDDITRNNYHEYAVKYVSKYKPKYIGFGIEINLLLEKNPLGYENFIEFYKSLITDLHAVSPDTHVFTVFQLERMKGLHGGLFGGRNDSTQNQWALLKDLPGEYIAFTTYPGLIYKSPTEIPTDYYSEIYRNTDKKVIFTEIGWSKTADIDGWESSPVEQAEFINTFKELIKDSQPEIAIWSFLYDPKAQKPFNGMGLLSENEDTSAAFENWKHLEE